MKPKKAMGGMSFYVILLAVIIFLSFFMSRVTRPDQISLSELTEEIQSGRVSEVIVTGYNVEIRYGKTDTSPARSVSKPISPLWMEDFQKILVEAKQSGKIQSYDYNEPTDITSWLNIILILVMVVGMGAFIWFSYSRQAGDG